MSDPSLSVRIRVYDASGRLVRSLAEGTTFAGRHRLDWDGRDDAGRRAAAGLYLIRVESGSRAATRKVVLTR
ncbi:MAG: T9SS type A sorting domain-containing protein [bacterium]|nr:T9SS type A sorting domain-containing protein [bacterium]